MGAEIVGLVHWPAHSDIDKFDEDARPLPLDVHERVDVRAVAVFLFFLVVEHSECRAVSRLVPLRGVGNIGTQLHLHHVLDDIELPIPSGVDGQHRHRYHVFVR